jgi:class 3 adenylate cyclase
MASENLLPTVTAHTLFLDIVGFTLLSNEEEARQKARLHDLTRDALRRLPAACTQEMVRRDTGDGMALVFLKDPHTALRCAVEIAAALQPPPDLRLRIGLHVGAAFLITDDDGRPNVLGSGINTAQRVMDCGDAGHILLSDAYANLLLGFDEWNAHLHPLGEFSVKHDQKLTLWNYVSPACGNASPPVKAKSASFAVSDTPAEAANGAGGALDVASRRYIVRESDAAFHAAIQRRDSIVLVKGARQMGKTSLLARALEAARQTPTRVVWTDLQSLTEEQMATGTSFLRALVGKLLRELDLDVRVRDLWDDDLGANDNLDDILKRSVLRAFSEPLLWAIDEFDRIFGRPYASDVCGLFRSWHNKRAGDPNGPWKRLTLAIAHSTEPHLFIHDTTQSPFNVGTQVTLSDFDPVQMAKLNDAYDTPLTSAEDIARFHALVNGHPYLASKGCYEMQQRHWDFAALAAVAPKENGPFGEHLRRLRAVLLQNEENQAMVRVVLDGQPCPDVASFYRLRSAGILRGESERAPALRCPLYESYLRAVL